MSDMKIIVETLFRRGYECPVCIGQGAFGRVYKVVETASGKEYACKISSQIEMLFREGDFLAELKHPLFPIFHECWKSGDYGFLVMELVPGENLEQIVKRRGALSPACVMRIAEELAEGLGFLHERVKPIFFRDLKPGNVRLRQDGRVKLLDFGCACREGETGGQSVGTPGFAAPEQLSGKNSMAVTCDIYGFGKLIYFLMTGNIFFTEKKAMLKTKRKGGRQQKILLEVVRDCICEKPEERLPDMRIVRLRLQHNYKKITPLRHIFCLNYKFYQNIWKTSDKFDNK